LRGGGNILYITNEGAPAATPLTATITTTASALADEWSRDDDDNVYFDGDGDPIVTTANRSANSVAGTIKYTILGSGHIIRQKTISDISTPYLTVNTTDTTETTMGTIAAAHFVKKKNVETSTAQARLTGGINFEGPQRDFYQYLSFKDITGQSPSKYVDLGQTQFEYKIGYVSGTTITRSTTIPLLGVSSPKGASKIGTLLAATVDTDGNPASYTLPEPPSSPDTLFVW
jgi:hypothetical protein